MSEWQPIATYDALKRKPKYAAFWIEPYANGRRTLLPAMVSLDRFFGSRVITHWVLLPNDPKLEEK